MNDDVIIVGKLDDKELKKSIDNLIGYVADKTTEMAGKFETGINKMKDAMKDFAITQKVSVSLMKDAWRDMSASFDAMVRAQEASKGKSPTGTSAGAVAPETIAGMREQLRILEQERESMVAGTAELHKQNAAIDQQKAKLSNALESEKRIYETRKKNVGNMMEKDVTMATGKLREMYKLYQDMRSSKLFNDKELSQVEVKIKSLIEKIRSMRSQKPMSMTDVLNMPEKTLDDIATKMRAIANIRGQFGTNSAELQRLNNEYRRLGQVQNEALGRNQSLIRSNNALASSFGYIRNRIVYALTLGAVTNFTKQIFEIRGQYELLERSIGVIINDMSKGRAIFNQLNAMAIKSPFTLVELGTAAKQLTAYNFAADEVVDTTRRLADISAALGVPMERLVYNLGQIRAQTVLNARDARDFANAGLAIVPMLAKMYTEQKRFGDTAVTTSQVYDMMSKKMVSYADVMQVINSLTDEGGRFFDFQAKQADTLRVQMANLTLAYNNMLNEIGEENQGTLNTSINMLKTMLKNWREVVRIIGTLITTYGAFKAITIATSTSLKRDFVHIIWSIRNYINNIKSATTATAAFNAAMKANAIIAVVTALAALVSYFVLFNNSASESTRKINEIARGFDGIRKNASDLFVKTFDTNNMNESIEALTELIDLAKNELGITIPIDIGEINEGNVKDKANEVKNIIDSYLNFAQAFSETLVGSSIDKAFERYGKAAQTTFTNIDESVNTVVEALTKLKQAGKLDSDKNNILTELLQGQKQDESRLEYLQRLIDLYEQLGLVMQQQTKNEFKQGAGVVSTSNIQTLMEQQEKNIEELGIANKTVFKNMLTDAQDYYRWAGAASDEFVYTVQKLAQRIDFENIPQEQRTLKFEAAINKEATDRNWNEFQTQFAKQVANEKFDVQIPLAIDKDSGQTAQQELKDWQKQLQKWADANGVTLGLTFKADTTEVDAANEALQNAQHAQEAVAVVQRKMKEKTATQSDLDAANAELERTTMVARKAGADLSKLNKTSSSTKDALAEALKQEISLVNDMKSSYEALRKAGVDNFEAIRMAASGYESTLVGINKVLKQYGMDEFKASDFAGKNVNDMLQLLLSQRDNLVARGAKTSSIKDLEVEIQKLTIDAKTYNMKKITDGLNNELSKLKEDYELMVELQANPEFGNELINLFDIDTSDLPKDIEEYMERAQASFEKYAKEGGIDVNGIDFLKFDIDKWAETNSTELTSDFISNLKNMQKGVKEVVKSWKDEVINGTKELEYKLADTNGKIAIEQKKLAQLQEQLAKETNEERRHYLELQIKDQENTIEELKKESVKLMPFYTNLFADTYNVSTKTLKKIIDEARRIMDNAVAGQNSKGETIYTISETIVGEDGKEKIQETNVSLEEYIRIMKQIDSLQDKVTKSNPWNKIRDSFSKDKGTGELKNKAEGYKELGRQISEAGDALKEFMNLMEAFGIKAEGSGLAEGINDVAESLGGLGNIVSGMGQMESGDVVGGIKSMISGITSIVTAWGDNHNKKINKQVESSEKTLKKLEIAYIEIEHSVEKAMGGAEIKARKAAIANKELQLAELQRQLQLEQARKKKDRDDDRIMELQSQIRSLKLEINDMTNEVVDNLLGEDIKSAAESFVEAWVGAWREGEDVMEAMKGSFDDMIDQMIMKSLASRIVANHLRPIWEMVDQMTSTGSEEGVEISVGELQRIRALIGDKTISEAINDDLTKLYNALGIAYGVDAEQDASNLSQLQQGIQGITEVTANALEAYMNGVSQQVYYQSELMTQIRDAVVMADGDLQLGTQAQMLLQLQQSYQVQTAIQNILMGVLTPSGQSFFVELR